MTEQQALFLLLLVCLPSEDHSDCLHVLELFSSPTIRPFVRSRTWLAHPSFHFAGWQLWHARSHLPPPPRRQVWSIVAPQKSCRRTTSKTGPLVRVVALDSRAHGQFSAGDSSLDIALAKKVSGRGQQPAVAAAFAFGGCSAKQKI